FCGPGGAAFTAAFCRLSSGSIVTGQRPWRCTSGIACRYPGASAGCRARVKAGGGNVFAGRAFLFVPDYSKSQTLDIERRLQRLASSDSVKVFVAIVSLLLVNDRCVND